MSTAGAAKTWYKHKDDGSYEACSTVDADLQNMPHAKIWKNGATYFYFDIEQFGNKAGVVRNHLYDTSLTKIAGLGTPVYNPDEDIIPEKPVDEDTYIAAKVKILSWRLITSKKLVLVFYDPECPHCGEILERLYRNPRLQQAIAIGKAKVLAVYTERNRELWEETKWFFR